MRSTYIISVAVAMLPIFGAAVPAGTSSRSQSKAASKTVSAAAAASSGTARAAAGSSSASSSASGAAKSSSASAAASAVPAAEDGNGVTMGMKMVSDTQIANAVVSWMNDTGKVTKFLDTATSLTGDDFTKQATIALNAEKDELNHKTILDAAMGQQPDVQDANNVLAMQGTFQMVVDTLQKMVDGGPDTAQADVDAINQNRCVNVLPNIDKYFAAAGSSTITASRPTGCLEITNGPTSTAAANAGDAAGGAAGDASAASSTTADSATGSATSASSATATAASGAKAAGGNNASATSSRSKSSATRAASAAAKTTKAANNN
ncbi:hypothetical protein LQW54_001810 [Pestalotiopsis sp. IQ-011]